MERGRRSRRLEPALGLWLGAWLLVGPGMGRGAQAATYHVDPVQGDDGRSALEAQDPSTPWKTLTRALDEATIEPGDVVQLEPGTYDRSSGEVFPLRLLDGVAVLGSGSENTVLVAPIDADVFREEGRPLAEGTRLQDLALAAEGHGGDGAGLSFLPGDDLMAPVLEGIGFDASLAAGVRVEASNTGADTWEGLIEGSRFVGLETGIGLSLCCGGEDRIAASIRENLFQRVEVGVRVEALDSASGAIDLTMEGNRFEQGGQALSVGVDMGLSNGLELSSLIASNQFIGLEQVALLWEIAIDGGPSQAIDLTTVIERNEFQEVYGAVGLSLADSRIGPLTSVLTVQDNELEAIGGDAIRSSMSGLELGGPSSLSWTVRGNHLTGMGGDGIAVSVDGLLGDSSQVALEVAGNRVVDAVEAGLVIRVGGWEGTENRQSLEVVGNVVTGAGSGIDLRLTGQEGLEASGAELRDNVVQACTGDGVYLESRGLGSSPFLVTGNTLQDNGGLGLRQAGAGIPSSQGLILDEPDPPADLGGGALESPGLNRLTGNTAGALLNESSLPMSARRNYWGTTDPAQIDARILDDEELRGGAVDFSAPLEETVESAVEARLAASLEEDVGDPGFSTGDRVVYTASLTARGEVGCVAATFEIAPPPSTRLVEGSVGTGIGRVVSIEPTLVVAMDRLEPDQEVPVYFEVEVEENALCAPLFAQGLLRCEPAGEVVTDDPLKEGEGQPTVTARATPYTFYPDVDGDGFGDPGAPVRFCLPTAPEGAVESAGDCADDDPTRHPGAEEVCDGEDDDCDGVPDDGAVQTWYRDLDGDGYGDPYVPLNACEAPDGFVADSTDCVDFDGGAHPGAEEVCDFVDNDCDSSIDEDLPQQRYYGDYDRDGYGDPYAYLDACMIPWNFVEDSSDCNDFASNVNPGELEVCDYVDNNCDGVVDTGATDLATWYYDRDMDGFGNPETRSRSCFPPDGAVFNGADCDDQDDLINPAAVEVCDQIDNNCDGAPENARTCGAAIVGSNGCGCDSRGQGSSSGLLALAAILEGLRRRRR